MESGRDDVSAGGTAPPAGMGCRVPPSVVGGGDSGGKPGGGGGGGMGTTGAPASVST